MGVDERQPQNGGDVSPVTGESPVSREGRRAMVEGTDAI